MGWVWNVMLSFSNNELWEDGEDTPRETCDALHRVNAWIDGGQLVELIGPTYGPDAGYGMDANLYGGGFKHFDIEGFIEVVKAQDWKDRAKVQLWVKGAEEGMGEEPFALIKLGRRKVATSKPATEVPVKARRRSKAKRNGRRKRGAPA